MSRPKKHVFICMQNRPPNHPRGSCTQKGGNELLQAFWREQQKRGTFEEVAITYSGCIGPCDGGANVLVYPEGVLYGGVTPGDVAEIFERHLLGGEAVARLRVPTEAW